MEKRLTKKDYFERLGEIVKDNKELTDFINHEIELLNKKNSKSSETKTQKENVIIMETILNELVRLDRAVSITELQKESEALKDFSNQKLSALLKKLVDNGKVERVPDKKKTLFKAI